MMKKIAFGFSMLLLFSACSSDSDHGYDTSKDAYKITMKATVESVNSVRSGPINSGFNTDFTTGIYAYNGSWKAGSTANVINNDNATVLGAAGHSVTFGGGTYYYPSDGSTLQFFAFAPQATETTAAAAGTSPIVTIPITGQEDVMWAQSSGYKSGSAAAVHPILNYQHQLTQLQFTFKSAANYPASGNSVVSLTVNAQPENTALTVETGTCAFSGTANMQALSTANQTSGIGITTAGANANSPVMTAPTTTFTLTVVVKPASGGANVTYADVPVTLTAVKGSSHMITLTFTSVAVTASATVADWVTGTGGDVTIL